MKLVAIIFDGETKISTGKLQKLGGEGALNSNLVGNHILLAGHPGSSFYLGGAAFQWGRYWGGGVTKSAGVWKYFLCFMSLPYVAVFWQNARFLRVYISFNWV